MVSSRPRFLVKCLFCGVMITLNAVRNLKVPFLSITRQKPPFFLDFEVLFR